MESCKQNAGKDAVRNVSAVPYSLTGVKTQMTPVVFRMKRNENMIG